MGPIHVSYPAGTVLGQALFCLLAALVVRASGMIRYISNNRVAVVEKLWSPKGSIKSGIIALTASRLPA